MATARYVLGLVSTLLLAGSWCASSAANAEGWPSRKAGLWEVTLQSDNEPPMTSRQCIDQKTDAQLQRVGQGVMAANCSKDVMRREAAGFVSESVCKLGGSTVTSRSLVTGDFNSEIKMVVDAQYAPPLMGTAKAKTTVTQRWKGECPAGWKPGEMELPGMKQRMNVNAMPGASPKR